MMSRQAAGEDTRDPDIDNAEKYAGVASLRVAAGCSVRSPIWLAGRWKIGASLREVREYRFLRFAWKPSDGERARLRFLRTIAAKTPEEATSAGPADPVENRNEAEVAAIEIDAATPGEWHLVTRDLATDCGEFRFDAISIETIGGECAWFDEIWLARTEADFPILSTE